MSKYLLILTTAAAIGASYLFAQSVLPTRMAENERTYEAINEMLADQLAASGLNEAADWLTGQITMPTNQEFTAEFEDGGRYTATIQPNGQPNQVVVRSTGIVEGSSGDIERVREVVYELGGGTGGGAGGGMTELPPFMDAVVFAGGDLELGSLSIYTSDHTVNANVRTNSTNPKIGSGSIKGFVFYNSPSGQPKSFPTVSLYPYNPYHEPTVQHRDPVEIPPFDAESLQNLEGINIWTNPKKIGSTNIDLGGAPGNPAFWYFPDGLEIGSANLTGYAVIITPKKFTFGSMSGWNARLLIYANEVSLGSISLTAHIFTNRSINMGSLSFQGSITSRENVKIGSASIGYIAPPLDMVEPLFRDQDSPGELAFRPISYRSW